MFQKNSNILLIRSVKIPRLFLDTSLDKITNLSLHMEIVLFLNTDSFLLCLRRFIERRGKPSLMYSDNDTNFGGARNEFQKLNWANF